MPVSLPYEGEPIPAGYAVEPRATRLPVALGMGLLVGGWASSMIGATVATVSQSNLREDGGALPLFIPVAGPFIALDSANPGGAATFWLWTAGFTQVAGLTLLVTGLATQEDRLVLRDPTPHQVGGLLSPNARYMWPRVTRYDPQMPIPPGYHVEERPITGLLVTGTAIFAATYGVSAFVGITSLADGGDGDEFAPMLAPIVGPAMTIGTAKIDEGAAAVMVVDSIAQGAGAILLTIGAFARKKKLVRDDVPAPVPAPPPARGAEVDVGPGRVSLRVPF